MDDFPLRRVLAERIDDLPMTGEQRPRQKADYFCGERRIVIEVKLLTESRVESVRKVMDTGAA